MKVIQERSRMTENQSARTEKMSTADTVQDEISVLLKRLADPVVAGESVKACIRRASTRSGMPYTQTKRAWYREWKSIPAHIADNIRQAARRHDERLKRAMVQNLIALQQSDPDFYRAAIEELGAAAFPDKHDARQMG
jgi:hypothetical protein